MIYNKEDVIKVLPHREPFLFIDSCSQVSLNKNEIKSLKDLVGSSSISHYRTKKDHPIFKGHFPFKAILPGVIHSEIMAQSLVFILEEFKKKNTIIEGVDNLVGILVSIYSVKFKKPVFPEQDLMIKTKITNIVSNIIVIDSSIEIDNKVHSRGKLKVALIEKEKLYE